MERKNQRCPDCRKPDKLTMTERVQHKHCDECTQRCRATMETPSAHIIFQI